MRNVAGLSTSDAQKSSDMFAKCRYMDEITGNRGVIFATGTPVSNSMTELYTMQRYLQYERLQELNMTHFDCWASRFGETVTALELAPEGTGYRARTRFSKFFNLPELMNLFKEVADIKTADQLNLPTPEVEYHNIVAQPTEHQQEMVKALSERASEVHRGSVDPSVDTAERANERSTISMNITYTQNGDYLIPNIVIRKTKPIGHYGRLRKAYLEMHRPILFNELVLSDKLFEHCAEIDEAARNRMELIVRSLAEQNGVTEQLKAENQMEWVRQMNACKAQAEEIVKAELIYD